MNDKKCAQKFGLGTWFTNFGYRVIHHGYSLMSCPGRLIRKYFFPI